jgi:hypothetical protein
LILDGGETVNLNSGDIVVQRGTSHAWPNPNSGAQCNFIFCMIEAQPVFAPGKQRLSYDHASAEPERRVGDGTRNRSRPLP